MTQHLHIPASTFEEILQALPHLTVEADAVRQWTVIDGVEFSAPLAELDGAA